MTGEQIANFTTTDGESQVVCQRCKLSFPPGTQLFYMHDQRPTRQGKYLCAGCHQYHVQKTDTIRRTEEADKGNVHRNVAAAQREGVFGSTQC
jgi:hypothetical protein